MKEKVQHEIAKALTPVRKRLHLANAVKGMGIGVLVSAISCAAWMAASFFVPIAPLAFCMVASSAAILLLSFASGLLLPVSSMQAARLADAVGLKERALTALFLEEDSPMASLQREDAIHHIKALSVKKLLPLKPDRKPLIAAGLVMLAVLGTLFLPNPQHAVLAQQAAFQKAMAKQAEKMEDAADQLKDSAYTEEEKAALRKLMGDLARKMQESKDPSQAYLAMDEAQKQAEALEKTVSERERQDAAKAFEQSGLDELSKALSSGSAKDAQEAMSQLSESLSAEQEMSSAAESLSKAAGAMQDGLLKAATAQAAKALSSGDLQNAKAALAMMSTAAQSSCSNNTSGDMSALISQLRASAQAAAQSKASGQGPGGGQGGNGKGAGGGAGKGSTNEDAGISKEGASSMQEGSSAPGYKLGEYESIYDPTRLAGKDDNKQATGQLGQGETQQVQMGPGLGDASGQVPYQEVILSYQDTASKAAQQASLPESYQLLVDGYFTSLID